MAVFSARAEHHPPTLNSRRDPEVHCDPRLSLSIPGQEAWQAARWSPESFAQMLSPPPIPPPTGRKAWDYSNLFGAASKEQLGQAACRTGKVSVGGHFY